jgi:hypothetical protein
MSTTTSSKLSIVPMQRLKAYVDTTGKFPWEDIGRAEPLLRNLCGELERERYLILLGLLHGVPKAIKRSLERSEGESTTANLRAVSRHLSLRASIEVPEADWLVQVLAVAHGDIPPTAFSANGLSSRRAEPPDGFSFQHKQPDLVSMLDAQASHPAKSVDGPANGASTAGMIGSAGSVADRLQEIAAKSASEDAVEAEHEEPIAFETPASAPAELALPNEVDSGIPPSAVLVETTQPVEDAAQTAIVQTAELTESAETATSPENMQSAEVAALENIMSAEVAAPDVFAGDFSDDLFPLIDKTSAGDEQVYQPAMQQAVMNAGAQIRPKKIKIPEEVEHNQWCWSGFLGGVFWALYNRLPAPALIFLVGSILINVFELWYLFPALIVGFHVFLGLKGNKLAWTNREFESKADFRDVQRAWMAGGVCLLLLEMVLVSYRTVSMRTDCIVAAQTAAAEAHPKPTPQSDQ